MSEASIDLIDNIIVLELEKSDIEVQLAQKKESLESLYAQKEATIAEFDSRIASVSSEKKALAGQRQEVERGIGSITVGSVIAELASSPEEWSRLWYERLRVLWANYNVEIPAYEDLEERLVNAREVIGEIESENPVLTGELGPLLVPPSNTNLDIPFRHQLRHIGNEYGATVSEGWRVLVSMPGEKGLVSTASELINKKTYMMAGYDTRQLGATEYIALVHQGPHFQFHHYQNGIMRLPSLDRASSTLLLKNYHAYKDKTWEGKGVMVATSDDGYYWINESFIDWEKGYRPTVEV